MVLLRLLGLLVLVLVLLRLGLLQVGAGNALVAHTRGVRAARPRLGTPRCVGKMSVKVRVRIRVRVMIEDKKVGVGLGLGLR